MRILKSQGFEGGASSGVRPSALLAPADCVLARRSRPRTTRCSKPHRGFSLTLVPWRVRTLTSYTQKTKRDGKIHLVFFGASSGVRPSALPAPADCILARRSRPRTTRCSKPHRGFSLTLVPSRVRTRTYTKKQNETKKSVSFSLVHLQGFDRLPCLRRQTASSPGEAGLGPLAAQSLTGAFRLRSCPRGFEPSHTQKTKQDGKNPSRFLGASSGVRTLDTLIKSQVLCQLS